MYVSKLNRNEKTEDLLDFIRHNGFAILISTVEGKPWASHIPPVLSADCKKLSGHIARGNKQWREWSADSEVLAIFLALIPIFLRPGMIMKMCPPGII